MEPQTRRRRRPALSCLQCRSRKIKCDRNDPCGHCNSTKRQCTFDDSVPIAHRQSQTAGSRNPASSLFPFRLSPVTRASVTGSVQTDASNMNGVSQLRLPNNGQDTRPDLQDLLRRVEKLENASASRSNLGPSKSSSDVLGLQDSQIILNKTRMIKWSHWMSTGQEFALIIGCYTAACGQDDGTLFQDAESKNLIIEIGKLLQRCKGLARIIKMGRPNRCLSCLGFDFTPPSREVSDAMATLYFQSLESIHRILHVPTFWAEYQRYWDNASTVTADSRLKILLVIAIGSSMSDHGDKNPKFLDAVHEWICAAQTWLSGPLKKDRLEITGLQVHCLTIFARQIFSIGGDLVWVSMGSLIHKAMQMGLHRDPKIFPPMSILEAELRRRLWATILEMVVQSSLDSAMPPRISLDEFDTEPPSNINDDQLDGSTTGLVAYPRSTYTSTSMQLLLLDSFPIRLQILQLLNGLGSSLSYLDVLSLSSRLTSSYQAASTFLSANKKNGSTPFHLNVFHYFIRRFIVPLHCPFAIHARTNALFYYSLKTSLDAAMALIAPEPDEAFERLMFMGGGMFREGFRLAMTVISMELIGLTSTHKGDGTLERNSTQREPLKEAVRHQIALSLERLQKGETNIKNHMFLSMILAQAEAMETGKGGDIEVARAAKDSLQLCCGLLEMRVGNGEVLETAGGGGGGVDARWGEETDDYDVDFDMDFFFQDTYSV